MEIDGGIRAEQKGRALAESLRHALELARLRTLELLAAWPEELLTAQFSPLLSPLVWDLAHIANYEEQWLLRALGGQRLLSPEKDQLYDAFKQPRQLRGKLPLLSLLEATEYAGAVRRKSLELLDGSSLIGQDDLLRRAGYVYGLVLQHEHQHVETMLAAIQLSELPYPLAPPLRPRLLEAPRSESVFHEGGDFVRGSSHPFAYDNERPEHRVSVRPFLLDALPVTNAQAVEFVESGGYKDHRFWSNEGFDAVQAEKLALPRYWIRDCDGRFYRTRFGRLEPLPLQEPVQHVSFHEAEALARFFGKRLPTEVEWEFAARSAPPASCNLWHDGVSHPYAPLPAGALPESASARGVHQLFGDVWEWCASTFDPYPGFSAFPYREYSAPFFNGQYRVLRGGSWATHPTAMRASFRNWDFPIRRHIFAGVRCAGDV